MDVAQSLNHGRRPQETCPQWAERPRPGTKQIDRRPRRTARSIAHGVCPFASGSIAARSTAMSTGNEKRQRKRATRARRQSPPPARRESPFARDTESTELAAREHYRREKARRAERVRPPEHPLEQARRAYHALLAADAERAKGGRPKKDAAAAGKRRPAKAEDEPGAGE